MERDIGVRWLPKLDGFRFMTADVVQYHMDVFMPLVLDDVIQKP